jgi:pimeloyl-ACP methyl ester carboxylesterase
MSELLPIVFVPGLLATPRMYAEQVAQLWSVGPVTVANHTLDDNIPAIARRILASSPPRFALVGLSMGGYISMEIMRQAPERILKLALLDTSARPDAPEQGDGRRALMAMAREGRFGEIADKLFPILVDPGRLHDERLRQVVRQMAQEVGPEAFVRQQTAIMGRADSRPSLGAIRCPTLVLVGETDALTPPTVAAEIAAGISGSRLVQLPGCGHLSTMEKPDKVSHQLLELLRS